MKKFNLTDVRPFRVALVDRGAIQKDFLIYKNKDSKFNKGESKMKIEEAIKLGLIDESEAERLNKKDSSSFDFHQLMASLAKMLGKVEKKEEKSIDKMTEEEKKKMEDEQKKAEETKKAKDAEIAKQLEELTKKVEGMAKGQELLARLGSTEDPKEFLKILKEIKELGKSKEEPKDASERIVKALDNLERRLSAQELVSKGLKGQESTEPKKSAWGGAFR